MRSPTHEDRATITPALLYYRLYYDIRPAFKAGTIVCIKASTDGCLAQPPAEFQKFLDESQDRPERDMAKSELRAIVMSMFASQ